MAGLGTVGQGLLHLLERNRESVVARSGRLIEVTAVSAQNRKKNRDVDISDYSWFQDARDLANSDEIDVFVELIGGEDGIAKESVEMALGAGKHVVTANKALLAHHGLTLAARAEERGVSLNFEAAVAGGIPVVKVMRESLLGNKVSRIYGILNGTCNYILTRMEQQGLPFEDVLEEAQKAGYAEADPTFDVGGHDTAHKLALLTTLAFGTEPSFESIYLEGIQSITPADIEAADSLGYRIKLLGVALETDSGIEQRVHPTMVPKHSAIAEVDGVSNCVAIDGDFVGDIMLIGMGAGAGPDGILGDGRHHRYRAAGAFCRHFIRATGDLKAYQRAGMREHEGGYYIRLSVFDRPGAFAAIAQRMAEQEISLREHRAASAGIGLAGHWQAGRGGCAHAGGPDHPPHHGGCNPPGAGINRVRRQR